MSQQKGHFPRIDKTAMKENSQVSKSKLASRLYRNSSLNHINPNMSMLSSFANEPSILNTSSSNSQLIAGISLRKMKIKPDHEPYLSINNGKLLINKNESTFQQSSPRENKKQLFKKLEKLSHQPFNKILPDDLIDFPIEKEETHESSTLKKSSGSPSRMKKSKNKLIDGKEDLLPEDFIQMLEEDKNIKNQFCYLKKMDHPYDLKIIEFDKNLQKKPDSEIIEYPSSYITISSRGVTYFSQDQSRFVSLKEWKKEANYFKKIIKLDFFKNFKIIKNFSNWKKYLRKSAMKSTIQKLRQKLVYNDLYLSSSLLEIRRICYDIETNVSYCHFDGFQKNSNIRQFRAFHEAFLDKQFQNQIGNHEEKIKGALIRNMTSSMTEFKEQNKISSSIQGKGMPLLIGDQKNLEMPYTKQATLRTQQEKFQKFVKLVDLLITHSKVNMMAESTNLLARKLEQQNYFYQKSAVQSNYKTQYKSLKYLECQLSLDPKEKELYLKPTKQDLRSVFEDIVSRSVVRICRHHKKISSDIDVLNIIYGSQDQFPKESQSENLKAIMTSDNRQDTMLNTIMEPVSVSYNFILKYIQRFRNEARMHFQNLDKLEEIQNFQPKDHEQIKNYLIQWQKQKEFTNNQISNEHEGPLFQLSLKQFKLEIDRSTDNCIKKLKTVIPKILEISSTQLYDKLLQALQEIKSKPNGIEGLIKLDQYIENIDNDIEDYKTQRSEIQCLEKLMSGFASNQSAYKKPKSRLEQLLTQLKGDVPIAKKTVEVYKNNAKTEVEEMKKNFKLASLYEEIIEVGSQKQSPKSKKEMVHFINRKRNDLTKIIEEFNKIVTYEKFLNLAESDPFQINCFEEFFGVYQKIWLTLFEYDNFYEDLQKKSCASVIIPEAYSKLQEFINVISNLQKYIKQNKEKDSKFQFSQLDSASLNQAFEQAEKVIRPLIDAIECLNDTILGQKQWKEVRQFLSNRNKEILRILELDRNSRTVSDLLLVSASSELPFFKSIASKAKKNSEINKKLELVKNFTNFSKNYVSAFKSLTDNFKNNITDILEQVDEKLMMVNFVLEQSESKDYEKAKQEKNTLEKLRQILTLWSQYQEHVQYFQPIHQSTDWKNTAEAKLYISATQQNWKKTSKNYKEASLTKILSAERIIPSLKESIQILESLYPGCRSFFNSKRLQNLRLYFLSDKQILKILCENKDLKGFNNYINLCFPTIKQLRIKEENMSQEIISLDGEVLPIKIKTPTYEVEETLKIIDQAIKTSVKANLRNCWTAYGLEEFNKSAWIKDHLLQSLVFMTNVYFTQIMEQDYLCPDGDDLSKLYTYHLSQIENLKSMITQQAISPTHPKLLILLTQAITIRDVIMYLISQNVSSKQSYPWLRQARSYFCKDQNYNQYLNVSVTYDNQFVCMGSNPLLMASFNEKTTLALVNSMFCCNNVPIAPKSLLYQLSVFNAKPYNSACLVTGQQVGVLQNIVEGTWLTGSFTDLILPAELSVQQLRFLARTIQQIQLAISLKQPYLRGVKNLPLNKESGICLISPTLINSPTLLKQCKFDYRVLSQVQIPWPAYLDMLFEIYQIKNPTLCKKISGVLAYLQKSLSNFEFTRLEFKKFVEEVVSQNLNENAIAKFLLKKIYKKDLTLAQRKFVAKLFFEAFGVHNHEKLASYKSFRDINPSEQEINKIVSILRENKVCLMTGPCSQYKQMIAFGAQKNFSEDSQQKLITIRDTNLNQVLGYYKNGKWIEGSLKAKIKQTFQKKDCIFLIGKCTKSMVLLLQRLKSADDSENFINLQNNQRLRLGPEQRIIFICDNQLNDPVFDKCTLKIYDLDGAKNSLEEVLEYLTKKKVNYFFGLTVQKRYFSNKAESLVSLHNVYLNNIQKIGNSNLKMLGYKSQYNESNLIMSRFVSIINAALSKDKDKSCANNTKMIEKIFVWAMFWSICSSLPKRNIQRLDKLFESIKIQYDKSQSLSQTQFSVSQRNLTVSKFIKFPQIHENRSKSYFIISKQMLAKKQLIKLLVAENNHIMLVGDRYSGKSFYLHYLENQLLEECYSVAKVSLTKNTTEELFFQWLRQKIFIQQVPNNTGGKRILCSKTGKKLVIMVDNFNLINVNSSLFHFFQSVTTYNYYFDYSRNCKIMVGDVCFICSKTGSFQSIATDNSFLLRQFFPIYINEPDLSDIIALYTKNLNFQKIQIKPETVQKIMSSLVSLHSFALNLLSSSKQQQEQFLSYDTPVWIAKQIIFCLENSSYGLNAVIKLWKYLTVKKYVESGILMGSKDVIQHQFTNLVSLIVKKPVESEGFVLDQYAIVKRLFGDLPQIKFDAQEYYLYLTYLLKASSFKHLISYSNPTPQKTKISALTYLCKSLQIKFHELKNAEEIKKLIKVSQNIVVYVPGSNEKLVESVLATIIEQSQNQYLTFVIDLKDRETIDGYLRFYPAIRNLAHLYLMEPKYTPSSLLIYDSDIICHLLGQTPFDSQECLNIEFDIEECSNSGWDLVQQFLNKRVQDFYRPMKNIGILEETYKIWKDQSSSAQHQMSKLDARQEQFEAKKSQLIENLDSIKSIKSPANAEKKQSINKNLNSIDIELRKIKNSKKQLSESMAKSKESIKQKLEVYSLIEKTLFKSYSLDESICKSLQWRQNLSTFKAINGLLNFYFKSDKKQSLEKVIDELDKYSIQKLNVGLDVLYSALLGTTIHNIRQSNCVVKWFLCDFKTAFVTDYPEKLIEKLQNANADARECTNSYDLSQNAFVKPILTRERQHFGGPKTTVICKNSEGLPKYLTFQPSLQEKKKAFIQKIQRQLLSVANEALLRERQMLQMERKRYTQEVRIAMLKLSEKIGCVEKEFLSTNSFSQMKQIGQSITALQDRINISNGKLDRIAQQIAQKYGGLPERLERINQYLGVIQQRYAYANLNQKHFTNIIMGSLVFNEPELKQGEEQPPVALTKELLVDQVINKIQRKICQWICLSLTASDSIQAYFLFACFQLERQRLITKTQRNSMEKLLFGTQEILQLNSTYSHIIETLKSPSQNKHEQLLEFSQKILPINYKKLLEQKEEWLQNICTIFKASNGEVEMGKIFMVVGCLEFNCYKLVNREIRKFVSQDQNVLFLNDLESVEYRIQVLEKMPANQQGWIVVEGCTRPDKINRMVQYIQRSKNYKAIFMFQSTSKLTQVKPKFSQFDYHQITLWDKNTSISYRALKIFKKHDLTNVSAQCNKILKMLAADHISRLLMGLVDPIHKSTSFSYRIFECLAKKVTKLSVSDIILFALDFFYSVSDPADRAFLKQARKVWKTSSIPEIFDDNSTCQLYSTFSQNYDQLKQKLQKEAKFKSLIKQFLPESISEQITTDSLFGFEMPSKKPARDQKLPVLDRVRDLEKLNSIIEKAPILCKQQESEKTTTYFIEILKQDKKLLQISYSKHLQKLKKSSKLLQSKKSLSKQSQNQILTLLNPNTQILQTLLQTYSKITSTQKQIDSKQQINLNTCLQLTSRPRELLHAYMLEVQNLGKIDWTQFGLNIKCMTDKEKELQKEAIQKNQVVLLPSLKINNAKFQMHRSYIQAIGAGQFSRINNVFMYIGKEDTQAYLRKVPFIVSGGQAAEVTLISKAKQIGIWGPEVYVSFAE